MQENDGNNKWIDDQLAARLPDQEWQPDAGRGLARFRERSDAKRPNRRRWAWIGAVALVTSLSLAAFPVTRAFAERCVSVCVSQTSLLREFFTGSAPPSDQFVKAGGRVLAPDFMLNDASGQPVKLSDLRGKVVLLNFWATWCIPCKAEIPWFIEFQKTYRERGLAILGVSLDEDGWESVKPYMDEQKMNYRVMIGNDAITQLFGGVESLPATLIIDRSGRIAATHVGLYSRSDYEAEIQAVLGE